VAEIVSKLEESRIVHLDTQDLPQKLVHLTPPPVIEEKKENIVQLKLPIRNVDVKSRRNFTGPTTERHRAVVEAFRHAWKGYKKYAWGHDMLKPISATYHDWFGLGLTLVDALDTMYIMNLQEEFKDAKSWVESSLHFDVDREVNLFEVSV